MAGPGSHFHHTKEPCTVTDFQMFTAFQSLSIDLGGDGAHLHTFDGFYRVQSLLDCDQMRAFKLRRGKSAPLD